MGYYEKRDKNKINNPNECHTCSIDIICFNNWENIGNFSWSCVHNQWTFGIKEG